MRLSFRVETGGLQQDDVLEVPLVLLLDVLESLVENESLRSFQ